MGGAQLNQKWLRLLSLTSDHMKPPEITEFDLDTLPEVNFRDWEFWADISNMACTS